MKLRLTSRNRQVVAEKPGGDSFAGLILKSIFQVRGSPENVFFPKMILVHALLMLLESFL